MSGICAVLVWIISSWVAEPASKIKAQEVQLWFQWLYVQRGQRGVCYNLLILRGSDSLLSELSHLDWYRRSNLAGESFASLVSDSLPSKFLKDLGRIGIIKIACMIIFFHFSLIWRESSFGQGGNSKHSLLFHHPYHCFSTLPYSLSRFGSIFLLWRKYTCILL